MKYIPGIRYSFNVAYDELRNASSKRHVSYMRRVRVLQVDTEGLPTCWWVEQEHGISTVRGIYLDTSYYPGGFMNWLREWNVDPEQVQFDQTDACTASWLIAVRRG